MTTSRMRRAAMAAIALSLAGCATPVVPQPTVPAVVADTGSAPVVPAAAAPTDPAAPAAPAPATAAFTIAGTAAFQADALAGYAVRAYNAFTGAEIALASPVVTDAAGKFTAALSGVAAGQYVKLVATKGNVAVEATLAAGKADAVTLNAASTFLSQVAAGPLEVAGWLSADKAGAAADAYMAELAKAQAPVTAALTAQNAAAGAVVRLATTPAALSEQDATYTMVLDNAALSRPLTLAAAAVVAQLAPTAAPAAGFRVLESARRSVRFRGTQLQVSGGDGQPAKLTNVVTGREVDASKPEHVQSQGYVRPSRSHRGSTGAGFSLPDDYAVGYGSQFIFGTSIAMLIPTAGPKPAGVSKVMSLWLQPAMEEQFGAITDGYKLPLETPTMGGAFFGLCFDGANQLVGAVGSDAPTDMGHATEVFDGESGGFDTSLAPAGLHYRRYSIAPPAFAGESPPLIASFALNGDNEIVGFRLGNASDMESPMNVLEAHRLDLMASWPVPGMLILAQ